jgi:TP901 family phage tail tape measure protein
LADERPPVDGDATDFEAAAKAAKAKATRAGKVREETARTVTQAAEADLAAAKTESAAVKKAAARRPKVPAAPSLTSAQADTMADYLAAAQRGDEASIKRAAALRQQLTKAGVLGANTIGNYGQIPRATTPTLGSKAWQTELEKAQKSPGFSFTPDPKRLAREMARAAMTGTPGGEWFTDELQKIAAGKTQKDKAAQTKQQQQVIDALRPLAEQRIAELPAPQRKKIADAVATLRGIDPAARGSYAEIESGQTKLLNAIEGIQGVGATAQRKPKITYASPAVEKEIKAQNARRAAVEAMRKAGAGQYAEPIGPETGEVTAPARRRELEAQRRKVASRLRAAERRYEGNDLSTPANQQRIENTLLKHKAELDKIEDAISATYQDEYKAQARREGPGVKARLGITTPAPKPQQEVAAVENAEERKTQAVAKGAAKRKAIREDERPAQGDPEEAERFAREHGARLAAALDPEGKRRLAARMAPVTDPAAQETALAELEAARGGGGGGAPPKPPAPPGGPPDDPNERRRLLQRLHDALARRAAEQEELARVAEQETRDAKVAAEIARRRTRAEINAAASAQLAAERVAARVGPEHEETRQRVQQGRLDRRLARAKERQARQAEAQAQAAAIERVQAARAAGAGQYGEAIGPRGPTPAEAARAAGAGQYEAAIGPRRPTGRERREVDRERSRVEREGRRQAQQVDESAATLAEATRLSNEYTAAQARLGSQLERTAISADLASQRFRKHGALTTEFIEAAAKGEVTVGELGYQLTATVGKFAGWTAAASAVYGVVGAFAQVTEGAIAASSAVGLVGRVVTQDLDPGKLQTGLIDLSQQFNVPIQDVADAVYGAGKSFHDLPGAIEGARAALFAMKVGELDAGAATQSLTAIINGFKLGSGELIPVMDTINNVTNKFGGNVGQLVQGVAKAGGQFLSAGGNYRELVAILSTGARLTGATAEEVATAVGRSASVLRTPAGAARARAAGLDPTQDPLAVLQQAQQLARGASPERVQELARALVPAGGQFARIFVPLIQNAEKLNAELAETTPEKTKDSAQRELTKVLSQANEQIAKVANSLQQLGVALADAGLLTPILLFVKGINVAVNAVTDLVQLFDKVIPDPFEKPLATLLELYGVLRLLRRFDIGGQIAPGSRLEPLRQFVSAGPERASRRQILQGIRAERKFLVDERERVGQRAAVGAFRERAAHGRLDVAIGTGDDDLIKRRSAAFKRASEQAADLAEEEADLRNLINENDKRRVDTLKNIRSGQTAEQAFLGAGGSYRTDDVARPTTRGPVRVSPGDFLPANQVRQVAQETEQLEQRMSGFRGAIGRVNVTSRAAAATASGTVRATRAAVTGLRAGAAGLVRLGATIGASLGPLDAILLGLVGVYELVNQAQKANERHADRLKAAQRPTSDLDQLQRQIDTLPKQPGPPAYGAMRFGKVTDPDVELHDRLQAELRARQAQRQAGRGLSTGEIQQRLAAESAIAATPKEQIAALQKALTALDQGYAALYGARDLRDAKKKGDKDAIAAAQAVMDRAAAAKERILSGFNALATAGSALEQALAAIKDSKGLQAFIDQQAAVFELAGGTGPAGAALGAATARAAQLYAEGGDVAEYLKELKAAEDAIISAAETRLQRALDTARAPGERRRARHTYLATVRKDFGIDDDQDRLRLIDEQQASRQRRIANLQAKRKQLQAGPAIDPLTGKPKLGGFPGGLTPEEDAKLTALNEDAASATKAERALRLGLRQKKERLSDIEREINRAEFEEATARFEARTDVVAARQPAGGARIAYQLRRIGIEIGRAIKEYGRQSKEVLQLIGERQQAQQALVQEQAGLIEAQAEHAAAAAGSDQVAAGNALIKGLQQKLALAQKNPQVEGLGDPTSLLSIQTQILQARTQLAETVRQQATDLIEAQYALRESLNDDPVYRARLEARKAAELLRRGGFQTQADRLRAQADANNAKREAQDLAVQAQVENIDYDVDIGKKTIEQQIAAYEKLLKTSKMGQQKRKEIEHALGRLKHEAETADQTSFELGLGNIRIPTMYEVARLVKGGPGGVTTAVNNANTVNVTVNGPQDYEELGRVLERHVQGTGKSMARAAQMR